MSEQRIVLKQRRDLGEIIETAVNLYFQNFAALFVIASVVVPLGIAGAAFQQAIEDEATEAAVFNLVNVAQLAVSLLAAAAIIASLAEIDAGRRPDFSRAYDVAFSKFWTLAFAGLRVLFHVLLFFITIIGIPWAIQRLVRWFFVEQAVILDGTSAKAALSYSADAVEGSWWRTLGIALLIGIIAGVPTGIIAGLFSLAPVLVSGTVNAVVNAAVLPFGVSAMTVLYMDLKTRRESSSSAAEPPPKGTPQEEP